MSPRRSDTREKMVRSTVAVLREHGAHATTIDRVLAHSGAPRGSVYHHFPRGRDQLIEEAVAAGGASMLAHIRTLGDYEDPVAAVDAFFEHWCEQLTASNFRSGCPITAAAVEVHDDTESDLTARAGTVFTEWQQAFADLLTGHGLDTARARRLATLIVAAEEGAVVLCRAQRSADPMKDAAAEVHDLLKAVFADPA